MHRQFFSRVPHLGIANRTRVAIDGSVLKRMLMPGWCWPWRFSLTAAAAVAFVAALLAGAANPQPVVGPGATRDDVIAAYGWPTGQSRSGTKEIFNYPQGQVTLENGRVERVDFSISVQWPAPRPRPGPASPTTVRKGETPVDFWLASFDEAAHVALERHARILALFTGSDWSPPSKQFHDEVELHPDFVNAFTGDFVFLRLDFASRAPVPAAVREQNAVLRTRYGVTTYPSLLVLSPAGTLVAQVDLTKPQPGDSYRDRVISAVREVRELLVIHPPPADPVPAPVAPVSPVASTTAPTAGSAATEPQKLREPNEVTTWVDLARAKVVVAVVVGALFAAVALWLMWRKRGIVPRDQTSAIADRISDAASGLPTATEIAHWPREKVRAVAAGLAETEGFLVERRPSGDDADLALKRPGEPAVRVLVCCAAGKAGVVPARSVRELLATLTAEGVPVGWFVAPMGFSTDARAYAEQHGLLLIDGERLLGQLHELPPLLVPRVMTRTI